uniref:Xylanolytic transcriptional activator regulatory domain-containing protein n=1 Tax=Bionectria ochroleuca TaxID=29856 RepID=A0A8H7N520_BIOOC
MAATATTTEASSGPGGDASLRTRGAGPAELATDSENTLLREKALRLVLETPPGLHSRKHVLGSPKSWQATDSVFQFTALYRRGRPPSIEPETGGLESESPGPPPTEERFRRPPAVGQDVIVSENIPRSPLSMGSTGILESTSNGQGVPVNLSSRNSPEPVQTDQQGHYVGPSSGASFLLRIQRKLQQQPSAFSSDSSIFTFGDLPLQEPPTRFLILPPRTTADALLRRYFEFGAATHRFLHRPTVEEWLHELYETNGVMRDPATSASKTALLFMVFASAESYPRDNSGGKVDPAASARYFFAAEEQLSAEKGAIRLTSVQASLFGTTAHLMLALGIHRKSHRNLDHVEVECRKRTFWCAYNLDTYLSASLGRPRTFREGDIDQEMPLCVDDGRLSNGGIPPHPPPNGQSLTIMSGAVAHIKLSRIVGNILHDLYDIHPPSTENLFKLAAKYTKEIESWRIEASYLVDKNAIDPSLLQPIFRRQQNVLSLASWHAQILVHRPFLLSNFSSLANLGSTKHRKTQRDAELADWHVQSCLNAAMNIMAKFDELNSVGQLYNTFWFSLYFAFCAVVMVYVYAIQQRHSPPESYMNAFQVATKCQSQIMSIAMPGSLAHRYGLVLQELRLELLRLNSHLMRLTTSQDGAIADGVGIDMGQTDAHPSMPSENNHVEREIGPVDHLGLGDDVLGFVDGSPGSSIVQMAGWSQFDSLVTGGFGSFRSYLGETDIGLEPWIDFLSK